MIRDSHIAVLLSAMLLAGDGQTRLQPLIVDNPAPHLRQIALPAPRPRDASLRRAPFPGPVPAQFVRIIDGDTFEARVRVWFGQEITTLVRIRGFDAPELKSRCPAEAEGARAASDLLEDFLRDARIELQDIALDKYGGRVLANVLVADAAMSAHPPENVASMMLATGIVRPYAGGKRQSWCGLSARAD